MSLLQHYRFRPTFWPTVFTIFAVLVMLGLGIWQLQRLEWKNDLIARIEERTTAAPVQLDEALADPASADYRHASVEGQFLHDHELYLAARSMNGNVGFQIVTPMELASGDILLVNRGWVPSARKDPATRTEGQVSGKVMVEGILREPHAPSSMAQWVGVKNDPARNHWFWIDFSSMAQAAGLQPERVAPLVLEANNASNPGGFPIGGQTRINIPNDHLQYAITWFGLALSLIVIYVAYHTRRRDEVSR